MSLNTRLNVAFVLAIAYYVPVFYSMFAVMMLLKKTMGNGWDTTAVFLVFTGAAIAGKEQWIDAIFSLLLSKEERKELDL